MACGKPPDPDARTAPRSFGHPGIAFVHAALKDTEAVIASQAPGEAVDAALARAARAVDRAIRDGLPPKIVGQLQGRLDHLQGFAQTRMRDNVAQPARPRGIQERGTSVAWAARRFWNGSARRNAGTVARALTTKEHWASKKYKQTLLKLVEQNARIPDNYRAQLPEDVARVLSVCPDAAGLVKAMTLRGQGRPLGSSAKLGSDSNVALGSAYELIGTSALIRSVSTPVNGGPRLYIDPARDDVSFGAKSTINREMNRLGVIELPTRRTIESDLRIGRGDLLSGYREIGVDFKHSSQGVRHASEDLRSQVVHVARAIRHGDIDEFHFATNGKFGDSFRTVVEAANEELRASGHTIIACHEYVTTIPQPLI